MAGDIDVIFTADDKDVAVGIDRLQNKAGGFAKEWNKAGEKIKEQFTGFKNIGPAVGGAIAASVGVAARAVIDYGDQNDLVKAKLDAIRDASQKLWTGIGRDISGLLGSEGAEVLKWAEKARKLAVNSLVFWKDTDAIDAEMKATEMMIQGAKDAATIKTETRRVQAEMLALQGDEVGAARIRAMIEREAADRRLNDMNITNSAEKNALQRAYRLKELAEVKAAIDKKAANDEAALKKAMEEDARLDAKDRADQEAVESQKEQQALARERLEFELESARVAAMRGKATAEEVERAERELSLRQKLAELNKNEYLSDAEKSAAAAQLRKFSDSEALAKGKESKAKTIAVDGGINASGGAIAAAVGAAAAPGVIVAKQTLTANLRTAKAVEQIARNGVSAAFA